jgi:hypothetical protein
MITISSTPKADAGREPIFSIDGTEYTIPREVPASVGLEAIERTAQEGEAAGSRWLMIKLLGQEGYDALRTCQGLEKSDLAAVQRIIREKVFGPEEGEGKG